jgi:hypothetical protein
VDRFGPRETLRSLAPVKPRFYPLKTVPSGRAGKPDRRGRSAPTPSFWINDQERPVIHRQRPGQGYRHVLRKRDIERFLAILPDWAEISHGLNAILLAPGRVLCQGWHRPGIVAICAWSRDLEEEWENGFVEEHRDVLERLEVALEPSADGLTWCRFTEPAVRGFQLMHVLLHELGHHHDRMMTRSRRRTARGEAYAEKYARWHSRDLWPRYLEVFGSG